ncbi:hypothetical protein RUM44_007303 [Polyplax serrata]|uniref:Uncharacterized protein n=1 Tax=Polyplax serrata TaxID=468196 RepID=A0ABR1B0A0_POLSC
MAPKPRWVVDCHLVEPTETSHGGEVSGCLTPTTSRLTNTWKLPKKINRLQRSIQHPGDVYGFISPQNYPMVSGMRPGRNHNYDLLGWSASDGVCFFALIKHQE